MTMRRPDSSLSEVDWYATVTSHLPRPWQFEVEVADAAHGVSCQREPHAGFESVVTPAASGQLFKAYCKSWT